MQELVALGRTWLQEARNTMYVSSQHNELCETACLDCLLTFDAQEQMRRGFLNRRLAINVLDALLNECELPEIEREEHKNIPFIVSISQVVSNADDSDSEALLTLEERLQRANERKGQRRKR